MRSVSLLSSIVSWDRSALQPHSAAESPDSRPRRAESSASAALNPPAARRRTQSQQQPARPASTCALVSRLFHVAPTKPLTESAKPATLAPNPPARLLRLLSKV